MGATVIDELLVKIGYEISDMKKGSKDAIDAVDRLGRELKKAGRDLTQVFTVPIAGIATAAIAASSRASREFEQFGARVKTIFGKLGDDLSKTAELDKVLKEISSVLGDAVDWFVKLPPAVKNATLAIAALAAIVGPLLIALGSVIGAITAIVGVLAGPVGFVALIVAAVAAVGVLAYKLSGIGTKSAEEATAAANDNAEAYKKIADEAQDAARALDELRKARRGETGAMTSKKTKEEQAQAAAAIPAQEQRVRDLSTGMSDVAKYGITRHDFYKQLFSAMDNPPEPGTADQIPQESPSRFGMLDQLHQSMGGSADAQKMLEIQKQHAAQVDALVSSYNDLGGGVNVVAGTIEILRDNQEQLRAAGFSEEAIAPIGAAIDNLQTPMNTFIGLLQQLPSLGQMVGQALFDITQSFSQGVGQAVAQIVVYSASVGQVFKNLMKAIAAQVIQTLIAIGIQKLITAAIVGTGNAKEAASGLASLNAQIYAAAFLAYTKTGIVGLALAAPGAAAHVALALGGEAGALAGGAGLGASVGGLAEGGVAVRPALRIFGEAGPEAVIPLDRAGEFLGGGGGRPIHLDVRLGDDVIIQKVIEGMPEYLRIRGVA